VQGEGRHVDDEVVGDGWRQQPAVERGVGGQHEQLCLGAEGARGSDARGRAGRIPARVGDGETPLARREAARRELVAEHVDQRGRWRCRAVRR
jgi:hypothetical protein